MLVDRETGDEVVPVVVDETTGERLDVRKVRLTPAASRRSAAAGTSTPRSAGERLLPRAAPVGMIRRMGAIRYWIRAARRRHWSASSSWPSWPGSASGWRRWP